MGLFKKNKAETQIDIAAEKTIERLSKEAKQRLDEEQTKITAVSSVENAENAENAIERLSKGAKQRLDEEQTKITAVSSVENELGQLSMPELWKMASSLGISKKGNKSEIIERIHEAQESGIRVQFDDNDVIGTLEQLKNELSEYEKIKEGIKKRIELTSALIPKLNEKKDLLEKDINQDQQRIVEVSELLPKLEEEKTTLQTSIQEKLDHKMLLEKEITEMKVKIMDVDRIIPKLVRNKEDVEKAMKQNQEVVLKIDEQIKQIQDFQKYGLDLLSTLLYATKKSKE